MENIRVSVAMAAYNGEKYLRQQIDSILPQLGANDELVISYNPSTDATWEIINSYAASDARVKAVECRVMGVKANFNNAIRNCAGKYIFLSDQDDVWLAGKVEEVLRVFEDKNCDVVLHDCVITDAELHDTGRTLFAERNAGSGVMKNIIKSSYHGCCLAFNSRLKQKILPIPGNIPLHDIWIGLIGNIYGKVELLDKKLLLYRRHGDNCSPMKRQAWGKVISDRYQIIKALICRVLLCSRESAPGGARVI